VSDLSDGQADPPGKTGECPKHRNPKKINAQARGDKGAAEATDRHSNNTYLDHSPDNVG
jgi:hypothetical protein